MCFLIFHKLKMGNLLLQIFLKHYLHWSHWFSLSEFDWVNFVVIFNFPIRKNIMYSRMNIIFSNDTGNVFFERRSSLHFWKKDNIIFRENKIPSLPNKQKISCFHLSIWIRWSSIFRLKNKITFLCKKKSFLIIQERSYSSAILERPSFQNIFPAIVQLMRKTPFQVWFIFSNQYFAAFVSNNVFFSQYYFSQILPTFFFINNSIFFMSVSKYGRVFVTHNARIFQILNYKRSLQ